MAPASPGGGWDQTSRGTQKALRTKPVAKSATTGARNVALALLIPLLLLPVAERRRRALSAR